MQHADQTGKLQFKRHNQPQNKPPSQFQHNSPQYQWQNYPANHNLTSFNPEQKQNHNKQQNNYQKQYNQKYAYASTPKVINNRVKFTPNVNTTKATTPKFFKSYNRYQQPCNQQYNQYNQHNQQYNEANMTPKSTDHDMYSPKFKFHTLQYGQQWTCNGISQAKLIEKQQKQTELELSLELQSSIFISIGIIIIFLLIWISYMNVNVESNINYNKDDLEYDQCMDLLTTHQLLHIWPKLIDERFDDISLWKSITSDMLEKMNIADSDKIRFENLQRKLKDSHKSLIHKIMEMPIIHLFVKMCLDNPQGILTSAIIPTALLIVYKAKRIRDFVYNYN